MSSFILIFSALCIVLYLIAAYLFGSDYSETLSYRMCRIRNSNKKYNWLAWSLAYVTIFILQILYGLLWPLVLFKRAIMLIATVNYIQATKDYFYLMYDIIFSKEDK